MKIFSRSTTQGAFVAGAVVGLMCASASKRRPSVAAAVEDPHPSADRADAARVSPHSERARRRPRRRALLVVAALATGVIAAGIAIGAWSVSGSGSGYAKAASGSALTLSDASASTTADLYPGATGSVKLRVTNPNAFPVRITTVTGTGAVTSDKGAACDAATGVTFSNQSSLALDLAAGATTTFTLSGAVSMSNASDNACQGAVFSVPVSVTAISNA